MAESQPSKLVMRVRFPSPAPRSEHVSTLPKVRGSVPCNYCATTRRGHPVGRSRRHQGRGATQRPPYAIPDPRVTYTHAKGDQNVDGLEIKDGALIMALGTVRLDDGRVIHYPGPNVASFNLLEARTHQRRAERIRRQVFAHLPPGADGRITDTSAVFDYLSSAVSSVLSSFAAIEGVCNALVDKLPDGTEITVERRGVADVCGKDEIPRRLSISEKLSLVAPLATGEPSIKGTAVWGRFVELRRLRDELVHVKRFGYAGEPENPQAYGRLLRGDGDTAVQDAARVVMAVAPGWLVDPVPDRLGI